MLNFLQVNLHKANIATTMAGQAMEGQHHRIMLITEPYTIQSKIPFMPRGCKVIFDKSTQKSDPPPRAAIVASPDVSLQAMTSWCTRDCAVAMAKFEGQLVLLVSIYCDITRPVTDPHLVSLMNMADRKRLPLLIGMDSNAHSSFFGPDTNPRGEELEDLLLQHCLEVHNRGTRPTFETVRGDKHIKTHIDVTLSRALPWAVCDWRIDSSYNASDHNSILFSLPPTERRKQSIRPWGSADWNIFRDSLRKHDFFLPESISMKKLDKMVESLYSALNQALDRACPMIEVTPTAGRNHWSTETHAKGKREVSDLYSRAKASGCPRDWAKYKEADRNFKKLCHRDRNRAWRKYKESIQSQQNMASLARLAQRRDGHDIDVLRKSDGSSTLPGKDTVHLLTQTHFPNSTETRRIRYNNHRNLPLLQVKEKFSTWINHNLICQALAGFEKKKSPGPDGIKPLVFEHLTDNFIEYLQVVYKLSLIHI